MQDSVAFALHSPVR